MIDTIREEYAMIARGNHFWCETHLSAIHIDYRSPDPRYCLDCYNYLLKEAKMLENGHSKRLPYWVPQKPVEMPLETVGNGVKPVTTSTNVKSVGGNDVTAKTRAKTPLDDAISGLVEQGLSSRDIAEQLSLSGFNVSYRTVARWMKKKGIS